MALVVATPGPQEEGRGLHAALAAEWEDPWGGHGPRDPQGGGGSAHPGLGAALVPLQAAWSHSHTELPEELLLGPQGS